MDVLSHWLWGMAVTHGKIKGRFSGAMGVIPDLMAFLPVTIISLFTGHRNPRVDDTSKQLEAKGYYIGRYTDAMMEKVVTGRRKYRERL